MTAAERRAWDEGREAAWRVAEQWANSKSCAEHHDNPCCHVRTGVVIANAIRALEPLEPAELT